VEAATDPPAVLPDCGPSPDVDATDAGPDGATEGPTVPRRRLKLVVTLDPSDATGRAVLGLAADGCDPELRVVPAAGLVEALAEVPALVAAAEARWRAQPRYPPASAPPRRTAPPGPTVRPAGGTEPASAPAAPAETTSEPAPTGTANADHQSFPMVGARWRPVP
jgi:hypothetical protein